MKTFIHNYSETNKMKTLNTQKSHFFKKVINECFKLSSILIIALFLILGAYQNTHAQFDPATLFCPDISITNGALDFDIDYSTNSPSSFTVGLIGSVEAFNGDNVGGLDWMHIDNETVLQSSFTPTNQSGSQLVSWWTQKDARNSFLQVTNGSQNLVNIHIRIFNESCQEIRDFCDVYTGNDTHEYNFGDLIANTGADIADANLQGNEGWFVVTAVQDCGSSNEVAIEHNSLAGQLMVHDSNDYLYGVNTYARQAICDNSLMPVCDGTLTGAANARLEIFNPPTLTGLFSAPAGIAGSDVVVINFADDYSPPYRVIPATSVIDSIIYDDNEESMLCKNEEVCFTRLGINEVLSASQDLAFNFQLKVVKTGEPEGGDGTVTSNPAGINCGSNCLSGFPQSTIVTLTAVPDQLSEFVDWAGDCTGTDPETMVTIDGIKTCNANFQVIRFDLSITKSGNGTGSIISVPPGIDCGVNCDNAYPINTVVTLSPNPDPGSVFAGWAGDPDCMDGVVTLDSDKSCEAVFNEDQFSLIVTKDGTGNGTVSSSPPGIDCGSDCIESYDTISNTVVTLTPAPAPGSLFTGWGGDADCMDGSVTMDSNKTCVAIFDNESFALTVSLTGTGAGVVQSLPVGIDCGSDCNEVYTINQVVVLTPTASLGSIFAGWSGDADCVDGVVIMDSSKACTATFNTLNQFTLNITKDGSGTGVVLSNPPGINCGADCDEIYDMDVVVGISPIPDPGSVFAGWTGDPDCSNGIVTMNSDKTCNATFEIIAPIFALLNLNPSQAGVNNTLTSTGATPNGNVTFIWGFVEQEDSADNICAGFESGILNPRILATVQADSDGIAQLSFNIPANLAGVNLVVQAADLSTCTGSNVNMETLSDAPPASINLLPMNPGSAGVLNTLSANGASPGGDVRFIWGFSQQTVNANNICPGLMAGVQNPKLLPLTTADGLGNASLNINVPGNAAGLTIFTQAVDISTCSASNVNQEDL